MENIISKEKSQVVWGVQLFNTFAQLVLKGEVLDPEVIEPILQEVVGLSESLQHEGNIDSFVEKLNQLIGRLNTELKLKINPTAYAPFPFFSYTTTGRERSAILDQFDMVERTLTQASESKVLDWIVEGSHFTAILTLFSMVESGKLKPHEGMAQLGAEIDKINSSLPEELRLPPVNLSAYDI